MNDMKPPTPRVAESQADLRAGQVVVAKHRIDQDWPAPFEIEQGGVTFHPWDAYTVVILSEPPPEPVTVSREAFDRLHMAVNAPGFGQWGQLLDAARAVVDEVRVDR